MDRPPGRTSLNLTDLSSIHVPRLSLGWPTFRFIDERLTPTLWRCPHLKACIKKEQETGDRGTERDDDNLLLPIDQGDITAFRPTTPTTTLDDDPYTKHRVPDIPIRPQFRHDVEDPAQELLKTVRRVRLDSAAVAEATRLLEQCKRDIEPLTAKRIDGYSERDKEICATRGSSYIRQDTDKTIKVLNTNRSKRRKQDSSSVDQTPRR